MFQTELDWSETGIVLTKEFKEYLTFLKEKIFYENLPKSLQEITDNGLELITGFNMEKWQDFVNTLEELLQTSVEIQEEQLVQWREYFQEFQQFLDLKQMESNKFYDDIDDEVMSIHQQGSELLEKLVYWINMENKEVNTNVITTNQGGVI